MKGFWKSFFLRGLICAAGGPVVMAIVYGIIGATGAAETLSPQTVCIEILSITVLAFVAAGMTAIYQMEQLPLPMMILLHGGVLYLAYILTYLLNGWLLNQVKPVLIFTGIFIAGYAVIWIFIYLITKAKTKEINQMLKEDTGSK